ncbi:MAG: adenylate/guanylate cyclase domain-containing protein [Saprospiraceae bacterium]|nr:adenylate/guanylate cyclase domain-containing protein [Saprospiraceae bacterium]
MESSRRLAAIMFTDIVGYTALMGKDEDNALKLLHRNRVFHKAIISRYGGEWLKEMGDGTLASFNTSTDGVRCAAAIQDESEKEGISLRIGIHVGEVVFEGKDVFGDGVNIASRIQELAPSGGIRLSESVHKNVLNKRGIETTFV